jgi:hypothetical protein
MPTRRLIGRLALALAATLSLASALYAQETAIAGTVKDSTGAVMPGVTVEVSSPALIEKTRTAVSDRAGQYKIIDLLPGVYTVTFTLQGFNVYRREGIELTYGFVAPVNAELRVGAVEEAVIVTAASPVVDVQSLAQNVVMTRDVMDAIPTGKNIQAVGILIPGTSLQTGGGGNLSRDVGGSGNMQQSPITYHGSTASVTTVDGLRMNDFEVSGQYADLFNDGSFQEVSYSTGADTIEMGQGGMRINMVPKDGGNSLHGSIPANWTGQVCDFQYPVAADSKLFNLFKGCWSSNNFTSDLANRGLTNVSNVLKVWDVNPSVGGPIMKDRLWYQLTYRRQRVDKTVVDSFYDKNPDPIKYEADITRPAVDDGWAWNASIRTTLQLSRKNKFTYYFDRSNRERPHWGATASNPPEASGRQTLPMEFTESLKYQATLTNRLLFEAGFGEYHQDYSELYQPEVTPTTYRITDQNTSKTCCAYSAQVIHLQKLYDYSAKLSYVTGSHSIVVGWTGGNGPHETITTRTGNLSMRFGGTLSAPVLVHADANGFGPNQVTLQLPTDQIEHMDQDNGFYVQDKFRFHRATINAGVRLDWFVGSVGSGKVLPNPWLTPGNGVAADGSITFNPVSSVPNWRDISPRLGIAYDLFGSGKTALKFSASRYVDPQTVAFAQNQSPIGRLSSSVNLTWTDNSLDYTIFNPDGSIQKSELAAIPATSTFGTLVPATTTVDPSIQTGRGRRGYSWEFDASIQHELMPRVSVGFAYWRRNLGGNALSTQNLNAPPSTFSGPYCITGPLDPRLPNGGGQTYCGIYEGNPNIVANNYQTFLQNYLDRIGVTQKNYRHGFDFSTQARIANRGTIQGGVSFARTVSNTCYSQQLGNPQDIVSPITGVHPCYNTAPFQPDVKISASYKLKWDIQASGTFQYTPGPQRSATWTFNQAAANAAGFSIPLAAGSSAATIAAATQSFDLLGGTQIFEPGLKQLDVRAARVFRLYGKRLQANFDVYNVFNSNWVFSENGTFGSGTTAAATWLRPTNVLAARMFKIGAQFDF